MSDSVRQEIVDEFGALELEITRMKPQVKRRDELKAKILEWPEQDNIAPARGTVYRGKLFQVPVSARSNEREIIQPLRAVKLLGGFTRLLRDKLIRIPLKLVEEQLPEHAGELISKPAPVGCRRITDVAPLFPPAA